MKINFFSAIIPIIVVSFIAVFLYGCSTSPTGGGTPASSNFKLTITNLPNGWGTVEADPGGDYISGTKAKLTAIGSSGHVFSSWEGDATGNTSPKYITMDNNKSVNAYFRDLTSDHYLLSACVTPEGAGTVDIDLLGANYSDGDTATLTVEVSPGYTFKCWSGGLDSTATSEKLLMNCAKAVTAEFDRTWQEVGQSGFNTGFAYNISLFVRNGVPYVAYADADNSNGATVKKANGSTWECVGNAGFSAGRIYYPSVYVLGDGTPYMAYEDGFYNDAATLKKFNGSNWEGVGIPGFTVQIVNFLTLIVSGDGTPYVAFEDGHHGSKASVMRYSSSASTWEYVGYPGFSDGIVKYVSFSLKSDGIPYVAYQDQTNGNRATVKKFNGSTWEAVGSNPISTGTVSWVSLFIYSDGTPYVAYVDGDSGNKATVMKFNGANWESVGGAGFTAASANYTSLFVYNGMPYVAYADASNDYKASVMKYDGSNWGYVGNAGFSPSNAYFTTLFISEEGTSYVGYLDNWSGGYICGNLTVKRCGR